MIVCFIPARGNSESLPLKNICDYKNKPMIVHSIELALQSKLIDKVYVDTDSEIIANIAREAGATIPYIRPIELAQSLTTDFETVTNFIEKLNLNDDDIIVHLRPTYPNRSLEFLNKCIELFKNSKDYDSLRTVTKLEKTPFKTYTINNNCLIPLFKTIQIGDKIITEPYNRCRQELPQTYIHNGCIDIFRVITVKNGSITGDKILPVIMNENDDIDTLEDLKRSLEKN